MKEQIPVLKIQVDMETISGKLLISMDIFDAMIAVCPRSQISDALKSVIKKIEDMSLDKNDENN